MAERAGTEGRAGAPWLVWGAGVAVYAVAVTQRSSFGVAGLSAADRFGVDATTLSLFVVIQLAVYSGMQLPVGVALDRWGPRRMLTAGSATMAIGQLAMALAPNVGTALAARVLIGSGDAAIFVSVVRLAASWFDRRRVPLVTQLTGIVGQLGQAISALPFALALHRYGWEPAFLALAALGAGAVAAARLGVRDTPPGAAPGDAPRRLEGLGDTLRHPGTWLGFWTHWLGGVGANVVVLMWGYPFFVQGQGLTPGAAGSLLTINVVVGILSGPVVGEFTARHPLRRSWAVLTAAGVTAAGWMLVLLPSTPRPFWVLALFMTLISIGGPASLIGLDFAATFNPVHRMGAAQGVANMGGFVSAVLTMLAVGLVLDHRTGGAQPTLSDYRAALAFVALPWLVALVGVLTTRRRARTTAGLVVPPLADAWARRRLPRRPASRR